MIMHSSTYRGGWTTEDLLKRLVNGIGLFHLCLRERRSSENISEFGVGLDSAHAFVYVFVHDWVIIWK